VIAVFFCLACSEKAPAATSQDAAPDAAPDAATDAGDAGDVLHWTWTFETVDDAGRGDPSIAIGDDDTAHVAYYAFPSDLRHAEDGTGAWSAEVVDDFPDTGGWSSVALAGAEERISYHDYDQGRLLVARGAPGAFAIEEVDVGLRGNGSWTSQAIDSAGRSHVGFCRVGVVGDRDLAYATDESGAWAVETVDAEGISLGHTAIAIEPDDTVHLVDVRDDGSVRHATRTDGAWAIETVPLAEGANDVAIAIAQDGRLHLVWSGSESGALRHAVRDGDWTDEPLDETGTVRGVALAIAADGALEIAYHRAERCDAGPPCDRGDLVHAHVTETAESEVVDGEGATGFTPSIAIGPDGAVQIAYLRQDVPSVWRAIGHAP